MSISSLYGLVYLELIREMNVLIGQDNFKDSPKVKLAVRNSNNKLCIGAEHAANRKKSINKKINTKK